MYCYADSRHHLHPLFSYRYCVLRTWTLKNSFKKPISESMGAKETDKHLIIPSRCWRSSTYCMPYQNFWNDSRPSSAFNQPKLILAYSRVWFWVCLDWVLYREWSSFAHRNIPWIWSYFTMVGCSTQHSKWLIEKHRFKDEDCLPYSSTSMVRADS